MGYARAEIVTTDEIGTYHCVSRCVRRAYLCGCDRLTGASFEHRREWIRARLSFLAEIFAIEVIAYAAMSNHLHSVIRTRPDMAASWTAEEIARRWRILFPLRNKTKGPSKEEIKAIVGQPQKVKQYRDRLSSISWFNRCLNENIARRANREDECTGRFWEGRFKCQRIFDVASLIACSVYVDLNPVRAKVARTPEESDHTSVQDRIHERTNKVPVRCKHWAKVPLVPVNDFCEGTLDVDEYLTLVDETGRVIREGKSSIPEELLPILSRLRLNHTMWLDLTRDFRRRFPRAAGSEKSLTRAAKRANKLWFHGLRCARLTFKSQIRRGDSRA